MLTQNTYTYSKKSFTKLFKVPNTVFLQRIINIQVVSEPPDKLTHFCTYKMQAYPSDGNPLPLTRDPSLIVMQMRPLSASKLPLRSSQSRPMTRH